MGAPEPPRGRKASARPVVAGVVPDVGAITKTFDYLVPDHLAADVRLGTIVRVTLQGRRVRGWVVDLRATPDTDRPLQPLTKVSGWGPPADLIDLARWAGWRWAGRIPGFLRTASPPSMVRRLPASGPGPASSAGSGDLLAMQAFGRPSGVAVVRTPPAADALDAALEAARFCDPLVLAPTLSAARYLAAGLRRAGHPVALMPADWARAAAGGCVAVGARAAAWTPRPKLGAVLVTDEHDEAYQEERAPTWSARDVAVERARRAGVPCVLTSPAPSLEALELGPMLVPPRQVERAGWPAVEVVDRRHEPPGLGLWSARVVTLVREATPEHRVVCVLNRKGRVRLLSCTVCGELARCEMCQAAVESDEAGLRCPRCGSGRPHVCAECGATRLKSVRIGVTRAAQELEALAGQAVIEVTADTQAGQSPPSASLFIGTEAVLHRLASAAVVIFLDFDQEVLAPRFRAVEQAFSLLVRAARLTRGREGGNRIAVQTRLPGHEAVTAALHADHSRLSVVEAARRAALRLPPEVALAAVSGPAAGEFVSHLMAFGELEIAGPASGRWLVRAAGHRQLCDALAATPRPGGRLRIEVDPLRE